MRIKQRKVAQNASCQPQNNEGSYRAGPAHARFLSAGAIVRGVPKLARSALEDGQVQSRQPVDPRRHVVATGKGAYARRCAGEDNVARFEGDQMA